MNVRSVFSGRRSDTSWPLSRAPEGAEIGDAELRLIRMQRVWMALNSAQPGAKNSAQMGGQISGYAHPPHFEIRKNERRQREHGNVHLRGLPAFMGILRMNLIKKSGLWITGKYSNLVTMGCAE